MLRARLRLFALTLSLATLPVATLGAQNAPSSGSLTTFLDYQTAVPSTWSSRAPSSSMRLAEYSTASVGSGSAEVVVYFFGPGQGGSVDANLERWKSQFSNPTGQPVEEKRTQLTKPFPITMAEYRGTYARGIGTGSTAEAARPNHVLIAMVVETPRGTLFFQCFGPVEAVEAQREAYLQFVTGLK
ncbi:MAG: hypothetical protein IPP90_15975 [Gemmatimonadaceae bacterium]|nr:hypothetical protein [Gemmatimonadaceae bacterium]